MEVSFPAGGGLPARRAERARDRDAARRLQRGDDAAWEAWWPWLRREGLRVLRGAGVPPAVAEEESWDLAGDVFGRRAEVFARYESRASLRSYLRVIATRLARVRAVKHHRRLALERPACPMRLESLPDTGRDHRLRAVPPGSPWEVVQPYLWALPPRQSQVVELRIGGGLSWPEVGGRLAISAVAARKSFARALESLGRRRPHAML